MDAKVYLSECRQAVDRTLETYFDASGVAPRLSEAMRYSLFAGGKRVRPALAIAACEAVGGIIDYVLPAACALEMIHTYSLIHDDLPAMDDDDLRRGRPTNHKVFGDALAILAGDALLTEAFQILTSPKWKISAPQRTDIIGIIAEGAGANGMVGGQVLDVEFEGKVVDETTLQKIHKHKTGMLIRASVLAGGRAAGAKGKTFGQLDRYGKAIGLAFQIADDILDVTATTEELGKDAGSDLEKNKATYPAVLGLDESRKRAKNLLTNALEAIESFGTNAKALTVLAKFIVERRS